MSQSIAVNLSGDHVFEPLPFLHVPIDYLNQPLFFNLPDDSSSTSVGVKSVHRSERARRSSHSSQHSGKIVYFSHLLHTPNPNSSPGAAMLRRRENSSESAYERDTLQRQHRLEYSNTKSFILRREAVLRREQERERIKELEEQEQPSEAQSTPIVSDFDPRILRPTNATRLRAEFTARRLKQKEMVDTSIYYLKGHDTRSTIRQRTGNVHSNNLDRSSITRLTRSARLQKEYTSQRIREIEQERIRKAQEEERLLEQAVPVIHSPSSSAAQTNPATRRPLEDCFNRATWLLHQRIAQKQEEIQQERDKEQAARDAILKPSHKPLASKLRLQQDDGKRSPVRQARPHQSEGNSNREQSCANGHGLPQERSHSSGSPHKRRLKENCGNVKDSPKILGTSQTPQQDRFSRTLCMFTTFQETCKGPQSLPTARMASSRGRSESGRACSSASDMPVVHKRVQRDKFTCVSDTGASELAEISCAHTGVTVAKSELNSNVSFADASKTCPHASQSLDCVNRWMKTSVEEGMMISETKLESPSGFDEKDSVIAPASSTLALGEKASLKGMCRTVQGLSAHKSGANPPVCPLRGAREVLGANSSEALQESSSSAHSGIDNITRNRSSHLKPLSRNRLRDVATASCPLRALISPTAYAMCQTIRRGSLSNYHALYFSVTQTLRRNYFILWKQAISRIGAEGPAVGAPMLKEASTKTPFSSCASRSDCDHAFLHSTSEIPHLCSDFDGNHATSLREKLNGRRGSSAEAEVSRIRLSLSCPAVARDEPDEPRLTRDTEEGKALLSFEITFDSSDGITSQEHMAASICLGHHRSVCPSKKTLQVTSFPNSPTIFTDKDVMRIDLANAAAKGETLCGKDSTMHATDKLLAASTDKKNIADPDCRGLPTSVKKKLHNTSAPDSNEVF